MELKRVLNIQEQIRSDSIWTSNAEIQRIYRCSPTDYLVFFIDNKGYLEYTYYSKNEMSKRYLVHNNSEEKIIASLLELVWSKNNI